MNILPRTSTTRIIISTTLIALFLIAGILSVSHVSLSAVTAQGLSSTHSSDLNQTNSSTITEPVSNYYPPLDTFNTSTTYALSFLATILGIMGALLVVQNTEYSTQPTTKTRRIFIRDDSDLWLPVSSLS